MKRYVVKQIDTFADFETPQRDHNVSGYFRSEAAARQYMENNFSQREYNDGGWSTVRVEEVDFQ